MASTSNNNTRSDYCLQQRGYHLSQDYELYKYKGVPPITKLPCFGINMGHIPNTQLSCNATNTESFLFGIGTTNLTKPQQPFTTHLKCVPGISFFPRLQTFLPQPLVIHRCQRPQGPFS